MEVKHRKATHSAVIGVGRPWDMDHRISIPESLYVSFESFGINKIFCADNNTDTYKRFKTKRVEINHPDSPG